MANEPLNLPATVPKPYLHLDNRALVLHDGRCCVVYAQAAFPWLAETLRVLTEEGRATRQQGAQLFGGFLHEDRSATVYAGIGERIATCDVSAEGLQALCAALGGRP
jgi:hypothetical protein